MELINELTRLQKVTAREDVIVPLTKIYESFDFTMLLKNFVEDNRSRTKFYRPFQTIYVYTRDHFSFSSQVPEYQSSTGLTTTDFADRISKYCDIRLAELAKKESYLSYFSRSSSKNLLKSRSNSTNSIVLDLKSDTGSDTKISPTPSVDSTELLSDDNQNQEEMTATEVGKKPVSASDYENVRMFAKAFEMWLKIHDIADNKKMNYLMLSLTTKQSWYDIADRYKTDDSTIKVDALLKKLCNHMQPTSMAVTDFYVTDFTTRKSQTKRTES